MALAAGFLKIYRPDLLLPGLAFFVSCWAAILSRSALYGEIRSALPPGSPWLWTAIFYLEFQYLRRRSSLGSPKRDALSAGGAMVMPGGISR